MDGTAIDFDETKPNPAMLASDSFEQDIVVSLKQIDSTKRPKMI